MGNTDPDREQLSKWLRLHLTNQVGSKTFAKLLERLGGIDQALAATPGQLESVPGIGAKTAQQIAASRDNVDVEAELDLADKLGVRILTLESEDYPSLLRQISDPPHVLYVKGELKRQDQLAVAVVGSRNCSLYGQEQSSRLSHMLAASGFTIVSGLARGIDTAAHRGALSADGRTIAVLGCGLAQVYPPENSELAEQITRSGALVSELPLRFEPLATTFPMRNRIIAGLSLGTIVVEARARSGALITARSALEENREVMAVPHRVDAPGGFGPHQLIKEGAKLIERIEDVLDGLGQIGGMIAEHADKATRLAAQRIEMPLFAPQEINLSQPEQTVMDCLSDEPIHIDEIINSSGLSVGQASATVTSLQLKALLKQLPGSFYQKRGKSTG